MIYAIHWDDGTVYSGHYLAKMTAGEAAVLGSRLENIREVRCEIKGRHVLSFEEVFERLRQFFPDLETPIAHEIAAAEAWHSTEQP